jgi:murein DD-endopeptidase MepM/ murein hydrolase activator NlpD
VDAQDTGAIRDQIREINKEREEIDKEIAKYQAQLQALSQEKQTLQGAIGTLDVSRSQTQAQISSIQKKISSANLRLEELSLEMHETENVIALDRQALGQSLRTMHAASDTSLIEQLISANDLADAWVAADNLSALNDALRAHTVALTKAKENLAVQKNSVVSTKTDLSRSNQELVGQKQALDVNRQEKAALLSETQASEAAYQQLIAAKNAQRASMEQELSNLEESLRVAVDPSSIPSAGSGVLSYPIDGSPVTQGYGLTPFARGGAYGYDASGKPKPHTGIDFGVPVGTPVKAALSGTVRGWGNTDAIKGCYSFGKWILIDHANGLSSVYLHLSNITVSKGQEVSTGDIIGNSGNSGYSTGPHLHFGLYVQQAVEMMNLGSWYTQNGQTATTACAKGGAIIPVAPKDAYLDPMDYL